ncbi:MAG TPA: rhodanese-like domain-containing protein [Thermoanaerobaculia bacterium]|nr:rhodanese-like domain-containing protein [Thermoanaerobaculia bacterium]
MLRTCLTILFLTAVACGGGTYDTSSTAVQPLPQPQSSTSTTPPPQAAMSEPSPAVEMPPATPAPMSTRRGPVASTATSVPPTDAHGHEDGARRISLAETRRALESGSAVLVDVRSAENWAAGHAKGAINIPVEQVAARTTELPRDKMIITYCA